MNAVKTDLTAAVAEIVGEKGLAPAVELAAYAIDGLVPQIVALPETVEQMSKLLAFADGAGLSVVPWGGAAAMSVGSLPRQVDIVLSTARLATVIDYSPEDLTVTVQAGVTLAQVQNLLAAKGQMLPLDPPLPERSTMGGILATNASGPLRYQFGMPRDLCLGTLVVYADGTVAKSGGRTVKNVAGYDMTRLHTGAYGTLGVIAEATFKVWPSPKSLATVSGNFETLAAAAAGASALRMGRIVPWSLVLITPNTLPDAATGYTVAVRLGGQPAVIGPQVERAIGMLKDMQATNVAEIAGAEESFWPALRDWPGKAGDSGALLRIGIAPSHTRDVLGTIQTIASRHQLSAAMLAYPGAATIYARLDGEMESMAGAMSGLAAVVKEWNGNLIIERCLRQLKERVSVWGPNTVDPLTQRVKQTFDPKGTLNPGRFVGGL